jgi:CheY-specific phosphatase CheX
MSIQFFGQYLLHRGRLTADQLLAAVKLQDKVNVLLGTIAVDRGYLTANDVARVNNLQRTRDKRFGELAIELGLLTESQLQELLAAQKQDRLFLGEALVKLGHLTAEQLHQELESFRSSQEGTPQSITELYQGPKPAAVLEAITDVCTKQFLRIAHFPVRPAPFHREPGSAEHFDYTVLQRFSGRFVGSIGLHLTSDMLLRITGEMLGGEKPASVDDMALDAAMEFVNIMDGNICVRLSQLGHPAELSAPKVYHKGERPADMLGSPQGRQVFVTPLLYPDGRSELCVVIHTLQ